MRGQPVETRRNTPRNLVGIINEVGRQFWRISHTQIVDFLAARFSRMVRSMRGQVIRARMGTNTRASICRGELRKSALTKTGALRYPKLRPTLCWSLEMNRSSRAEIVPVPSAGVFVMSTRQPASHRSRSTAPSSSRAEICNPYLMALSLRVPSALGRPFPHCGRGVSARSVGGTRRVDPVVCGLRGGKARVIDPFQSADNSGQFRLLTGNLPVYLLAPSPIMRMEMNHERR